MCEGKGGFGEGASSMPARDFLIYGVTYGLGVVRCRFVVFGPSFRRFSSKTNGVNR